MPEQHQAFFENLQLLMVGVHSSIGLSAMALTGAPGFLHVPTSTTMSITADQKLDPGAIPLSVAEKCEVLTLTPQPACNCTTFFPMHDCCNVCVL